MADENPEQSQHAADHVDSVTDAMDAVFDEIKGAAASVVADLKREGDEMKANMQLFKAHVVDRMHEANARFRVRFQGNGGPLIEHKPE